MVTYSDGSTRTHRSEPIFDSLVTTLEVPDVDDDEMWQILGYEHDPNCEWILTKAHREME